MHRDFRRIRRDCVYTEQRTSLGNWLVSARVERVPGRETHWHEVHGAELFPCLPPSLSSPKQAGTRQGEREEESLAASNT